MNFIFISPNFPTNYRYFCQQLANNGVKVLGVGDAPYDKLHSELKASLEEYYRVENMEDYLQMYRAVAYFAFKYGPIDWIESNNEYWLQRDAALRTAFHVTSGIMDDRILDIKMKSEMKKFYKKAGIPSCKFILASEGLKSVKAFGKKVGYPLFSKPNIGVGAVGANPIPDEAALEKFFAETPRAEDYIIEEYVTGDIWTYDAIYDADGEPLFENNCVCPPSIADIVINNLDSTYYASAQVEERLRDAGRRTVKAFGIKSRFVHCEFFCLAADHPGLGKKGDFVGLEVNMRPGGGFTPDMINYAHDVDVYKIWANMICGNAVPVRATNNYYTAFAGIRDNVHYEHSHAEIMAKYGSQMCMAPRIPDALSGAMGNQSYIARFPSQEEMQAFIDYVTARK